MNNIKNNLKSGYTQVPNEILQDNRISWKAKGILSFLMSRPNEWEFYMDEIKANSTDGKRALQSGIKELEEIGYLLRNPIYNKEKGRFFGWDWILDLPENNNKNRQTQNRSDRKRISLPIATTNNKTNSSNTNNNKKDNCNDILFDFKKSNDNVQEDLLLNGDDKTNSLIEDKKDIYPFEQFWDDYDKKIDRSNCERKWKRLSDRDKKMIKETLPIYKLETPDKQFRKNPQTYLNNKNWRDEQQTITTDDKQEKLEWWEIAKSRTDGTSSNEP